MELCVCTILSTRLDFLKIPSDAYPPALWQDEIQQSHFIPCSGTGWGNDIKQAPHL